MKSFKSAKQHVGKCSKDHHIHGLESKMAASEGSREACRHGRKCSKVAGHKGRCNSEKPLHSFWESSSVFKLNIRKRKLIEEEKQFDEQHEAKLLLLNDQEEALNTTELAIQTELNEKGKSYQ